jgi:hypothetical protein
MREWVSPVYAFFHPIQNIVKIGEWRVHEFKCQVKGCKVKVQHFLGKGDARSTGNMRKHVFACWGEDVLQAADQAKDANEVRKKNCQQLPAQWINYGLI